MGGTLADRRFGFAWLGFAVALGIHVADEATHDLLAFYNPSVRAIRAYIPFVSLPTFTFQVWLTGLVLGIALLLCVSPLAFRGAGWMRVAAVPLALVVGVFNASLHMLSSGFYHRWMPGVYSSPLLLTAALFLLGRARIRQTSVTRSPVVP
jgi:hypothetical protein